MSWFSVLKMPNPYGGRWADLTGDEYYRMDEKNKMNYHVSMAGVYYKQVKEAVKPRKAGQAPPATDDQIRGLRELYRFHVRQGRRIRLREKYPNKKDFYSLEDETDRVMIKPTYDAVERIPDTTKEMYDNYTREQKYKYWGRLTNHLRDNLGMSHPKTRMSHRMRHRMESNPNYAPPFEGDESSIRDFLDLRNRDVSEYYDFTVDEKRKYHARHKSRHPSGSELSTFHSRMQKRIIHDNLPTYPTPEAEREAEQ